MKAPKQCTQQYNSFTEKETKINLRRGTDVSLKTSQRITFFWIAHQEENSVFSRGKARKQIYNHNVALLTLKVGFSSYLLQYAVPAFAAALWCVTAIHRNSCAEKQCSSGDTDNSSESFYCEILLGCHFTLLPKLRVHILEEKRFSIMLVQK